MSATAPRNPFGEFALTLMISLVLMSTAYMIGLSLGRLFVR